MKKVSLEIIANITVGYQSRTGIENDHAGTHKLVLARDFDSPEYLGTDHLLTFRPDRDPEPYSIKQTDILFLAKGTDHFAYCVNEPLFNTLASGSFYIIRPRNPSVLPQYLAWWLNQPPAQRYIQAESQSTSIASVSKAALSRLEVRVPSLRTQETIKTITDLSRREAALLRQIAESRAQLITAACLAAIQKEGACDQ